MSHEKLSSACAESDAESDLHYKYEPGHEKMCFMSYANNKGADQPAHLRSLISAFVVRVRDLPPPCCVLEQDTLLPESTG